MFHLSTHECKLAHINIREEKHGEESRTAVDVKLSAVVPNDFLSYLHPSLKSALYARPDAQQDLVNDPGHLPKLRFEGLPELRWVGSFSAFATIHGAKPSQDLVLTGQIDKLVLAPMDGGSVGITFRLQALPDPVAVGKLSGLLGALVRVSVSPQEVEDMEEPAGSLVGAA